VLENRKREVLENRKREVLENKIFKPLPGF